jgi:hypothetical protein
MSLVLAVYNEIIIKARDEIVCKVKAAVENCISEAFEKLKIRCPI